MRTHIVDGFAMTPEEKTGIEELRKHLGLKTKMDVLRRLVWRHRHIPEEIKKQFLRARSEKT